MCNWKIGGDLLHCITQHPLYKTFCEKCLKNLPYYQEKLSLPQGTGEFNLENHVTHHFPFYRASGPSLKLNWFMQKPSQLAVCSALVPDLSGSALTFPILFCVGREVLMLLYGISATTQELPSPAMQVTPVHHVLLKVSSRV